VIAIRLTLGFLMILGAAVLTLGFVIYFSLPYGIAVAALVFVISMILAILLVQRVTHPLDEFTRVVQQLAGGNWSVRLNHRDQDELGEVALYLNSFSDKVRGTLAALEESKSRLETIVANMESGVLLVNSDKRIPPTYESGGKRNVPLPHQQRFFHFFYREGKFTLI
jgi:signal transduction histidine kinase